MRPPLRHLRLVIVLLAAIACAGASVVPAADARPKKRHAKKANGAGSLKDPIHPHQQRGLWFGARSHWLQPWRGYLDTVPAVRLRDAIGINFNVDYEEAEATARMLAESGFTRARVEIGWDRLEYGDPDRLEPGWAGRLANFMQVFRRHGIRPLILLNANHGGPAPLRRFEVELVAPAAQGDRQVRLAPGSAASVVPGRTGLDRSGGDPRAADVIFTSVAPDGTATLSRPLPNALPAGRHSASTLRFAPFGPPRLEDGSPNPAFEETLQGWLRYVGAVTREAKRAYGSDRFDVEVWNEISFGSDFLHADRYYDPPRERGEGDVYRAILERTIAWLRDPAHGVAGVGIGNGFASQRPWDSGATSPAGLTANSKHPYYGMKRFPRDAVFDGLEPLDARGSTSFREQPAPGGGLIRRDTFVPSYDAFFPEYILSGIQTETMIRDLSPFTTDVYGTPHGRYTAPKGSRPPGVWITEMNLDVNTTDERRRMTDADVEHLQAKATMRAATAFVSKGVSAMHFYAAKGADLGLIDPAFFGALRRSGGAYPGAAAAGETPRAMGRLVDKLKGATRIARPRRLSLLEVSDRHGHRQFQGNGTAEHPPLYDRDVLAFFPFQVTRSRYAISTYVMTRNLAKLYRPRASRSDRTRYDLPAARFRLAIGGIDGRRMKASATDPLTGRAVRVSIVRRERRKLVVELPLTDSPRMLVLDRKSARDSKRKKRSGRAKRR